MIACSSATGSAEGFDWGVVRILPESDTRPFAQPVLALAQDRTDTPYSRTAPRRPASRRWEAVTWSAATAVHAAGLDPPMRLGRLRQGQPVGDPGGQFARGQHGVDQPGRLGEFAPTPG